MPPRKGRGAMSAEHRALSLVCQARDGLIEARGFTGRRKLEALRDIASVVSAAHFALVRAVQDAAEGQG